MSEKNILIVEDELIVALDIQSSLEHAGYEVVGQTDRGEDAIKKAGELHPSLVLIDIGLKGEMDGIEAAKQIRARFGLPVIFLTAFSDKATLERARLAEPYGYLLKPFNERELISNIEIALYKHGMERKLQESEARNRVLLDTSPDAIGLYDLEQNRLVTANPRFLCQHGFSTIEELQASQWTIEFVAESDRVLMQATIADVLTKNISQRIEIMARRLDGSTFPAEFISSAIRDKQGKPTALVIISRDITERKQAENAMLESQLRLQSFVRNAPVIIFGLDANGIFTFSEGRGLRALNLEPGEVVGRSAFELYQEYPNIIELLKKALAGEIQAAIHDMGNLVFDVYYTPMKNEQGQIAGVIGVSTDITARKRAEAALKENESIFSSFLEQSQVYVFFKDKNIRSLRLSKNYEQMLGMPLSELLGKTMDDLFPSDLAKSMIADDLRILNEGQRVDIVEELNGRTYETAKFPIFIDGKPEMLAGITLDVTDRKQAEDALRESEAKYKAIFEGAAEGIFVTDVETRRFYYLNSAACRMFGYTADEFLRMGIPGLFSPEDMEYAMAEFGAHVRGEKSFTANLPCCRKDGSSFYADVRTSLMTLGGRPSVVGLFTDITARKQAEEALAQSEERFRSITELGSDTISLLDETLTIKYSSPVVQRLLGYESEERVGHSGYDLVHPDDLPVVKEAVRRVMEQAGASIRIRVRQLRKDGNWCWYETRLTNLLAVPAVRAIVSHSHDITEQKQAEEALRQSEHDLKEAQAIGRIGNWKWNVKKGEVTWSDEMYRIFGIDKDSYSGQLGEAIAKVINPDDLHLVLPSNAQAFAEKKPVEYRIIMPDKSIRHIWAKAGDAIFDEEGNPIFLAGVAQDITERKRVEDELHEKEKHAESLLRFSRGLERAETHSDILQAASTEIQAILGYRNAWIGLLSEDNKSFKILNVVGSIRKKALDEFTTLPIQGDLFLEEIAEAKGIIIVEDARTDPRTDKKKVEALQNRTIVNIPIVLFEENLGTIGTGTFGDEGVRPPSKSEQEYLMTLASHMSLTLDRIQSLNLRKQVEEALRESQRQQKAILDNIPDLAWLKNKDSRFIAVNEPFGKACGYKLEDLVGKTDMDIWSRDLAERYRADDKEVMESGKRKLVEEPLIDSVDSTHKCNKGGQRRGKLR